MRAIAITQFGPPAVLREIARPDPTPGPGEARIRVAASGVNRADVLQRQGRYPPPPGASDLPGLEVAGRIDAGDADALAAAGLRTGDRVCALLAGGGYAELCVAPLAHLLPVPPALTDVEAASLPEAVCTVWQNVFDIARLAPGETLLVQGGASGIGTIAIQLGKALGATVLATAGSAGKCDACRALGADHAIDYRAQDFAAECMRITAGRGVDVVLDMVAGDYLAREIECLAADGRLALIATQGGATSALDAGALLRKRLTISGSTLRARSLAYKSALIARVRAHAWPLVASGRVQAVVHAELPAAEAAAAHALMESGAHVGKIVLRW